MRVMRIFVFSKAKLVLFPVCKFCFKFQLEATSLTLESAVTKALAAHLICIYG
jgi:hypothetical protein